MSPTRENGVRDEMACERPLWNAHEWWEDLVWPRVFASPLQGVRVWRVVMSFFAILIAGLVLSMGLAVDRAWKVRVPEWPWDDGTGGAFELGWRLWVGVPRTLVMTWPVTSLIAGPVALALAVVVLGALCRGSACELATGRRIEWTEALGYAVRRWRALVGSVVISWGLVWLLSVLIAAGGVLLRVPGLDVAAAIVYPLALLGGAIAMLVILGYALGHNLFLPAVACDDADAIDAVQRAFAYTFGRPLRLAAYYVLGSISLAMVVGVAAIVLVGAMGFAARSGSALAGDRGGAILWKGTLESLGWPFWQFKEPEGTAKGAAWIVRFWSGATVLTIGAVWVSCACSMVTGVYLGIRRIADGQDMAEIHEPGAIEESMARALETRAKVGGASGVAGGAGAGASEEADYT